MMTHFFSIKHAFRFQLFIALLLGILGALSYAPFHLPYLGFVSFSGFIALLSNKSIKKACLIALFWGFSYFLTGIHWVYISIQEFGGVPIIVACAILVLFVFYLTLYPVLFAFIVRALNCLAPAQSIMQLCFLMPITWFITEWIRAHFLNGFAWLRFGYTQLDTPIQSYFPVIGVDGTTFLFTIICGCIVYLIRQTALRLVPDAIIPSILVQRTYWMLLTFLILIFVFALKLQTYPFVLPTKKTGATVSLIQGNVTQSLKWNPYFLEQTKMMYLNEIQRASQTSDLIILPEAAIPNYESNEYSYLMQLNEIARNKKTGIAVGILTTVLTAEKQQTLNSVIGIDTASPYFLNNTNRYNKQHLVPFGEYTPLDFLFEPLARYLNIPMSSMSAGETNQSPLILNGYKLLFTICYEVILSERYLENFVPSVNYLVTISNDAWFGNSIGPWQHIQMAQARALEFGRPLLRATNTGITAIIYPNGAIKKRIPQFKTMTLTEKVPLFVGETPYSKYGKTPFYLVLSLWCLIFILNVLKARKKQSK